MDELTKNLKEIDISKKAELRPYLQKLGDIVRAIDEDAFLKFKKQEGYSGMMRRLSSSPLPHSIIKRGLNYVKRNIETTKRPNRADY